jgi:hypothetical protein
MVATDKLFVGKIPEIYDRPPKTLAFSLQGRKLSFEEAWEFPLRQRIISVRPR